MNPTYLKLKIIIQKSYLSLFFLLIFINFLGCTDIQQNHNGEKGYECYDDGSCDNSLICSENVCIDLCDDMECFSNQVCKIENKTAVCSCEDSLHLEENSCISNKKTVECKNEAPENGKSIIKEVEITWNNKWEDIPACEWECDEFYTKKDNLCTDECYQFSCEKNSHCKLDSFRIPSCVCNNDSQKYGSDCLKITKKYFESTFSAVGNSITVDEDGNSYIVGTFIGYNNTTNKKDAFVTKINSSKEFIWSKLLNETDENNIGKSISMNSEKKLVTAGEITKTLQNGDTGSKISLKLVNLDGETISQKYIDGQGESYSVKSILINKDVLFVTGSNDDGRDNMNGFVAKYLLDASATVLSLGWIKYSGEVINSMAITINENIYGWGSTNRNNDLLLAKYSSIGMKLWEKDFSESNVSANTVVVDKDENTYVTSHTDDMSSFATLTKYDSNGIQIWQDSLDDYYYNSTKIFNNKFLYIVGYTSTYASNPGDYGVIIKYNLAGEKLWEIKLEEKTVLNSLFIKDGNLYITGKRDMENRSDLLLMLIE